MIMAPTPVATLIQFIEAALTSGVVATAGSPFSLSYSDPDQCWLIRKDLLSLLQEFPSFEPSIDTFFHYDGTSMNLLVARGSLCVPRGSYPAIPITIWLHEDYPMVGPMVFISPVSGFSIHHDHPFVDFSSGFTLTPYLTAWSHPRCSLSGLARNLVNLFLINHPFSSSTPASRIPASHPTLASKTEALDRLTGKIHDEMAVIKSTMDEEVEGLLRIQEDLCTRSATSSKIMLGLKYEKADLELKVRELKRESGNLSEWINRTELLTASATNLSGADAIDAIDDVFEAADDKSRMELEILASEMAIEDTIYALDKAIEIGTVSFETYLKQIRVLAREQFDYVAMRNKLEEIIVN